MDKKYLNLFEKYAQNVSPSTWEAHFEDNIGNNKITNNIGIIGDSDLFNKIDNYENIARDGKELSNDEDDDKNDEELKKIEKRRKKRKKKKQKVFEPHPFYSSLYGYTGFEGAYTSPLEYYSGSIADEPGSQTINPYNSTYQIANDNSVKIIIRSMILKDYVKYT